MHGHPREHRNPHLRQSTAGPQPQEHARPRGASAPSRRRGQTACRTNSAGRPHSSARPRMRPACGAKPACPAGRARRGSTAHSHCRARPRAAWAVRRGVRARPANRAAVCRSFRPAFSPGEPVGTPRAGPVTVGLTHPGARGQSVLRPRSGGAAAHGTPG